jgi:hypothetical protein
MILIGEWLCLNIPILNFLNGKGDVSLVKKILCCNSVYIIVVLYHSCCGIYYR